MRDGVNLLVLSDRGVTPELAPIPMLLATGAVHHHLVREGLRTQCGLVCETGEARDVPHFALLVGYGAGAINPYLAFETIEELVEDGTYVPARHRRREGDQELPEGLRQGSAEDDGEDGDLDAAELPRRADLRGSGPRSRARRALLHRYGVARLGRRFRRAREGSGDAPRPRLPRRRIRLSGTRPGRALSMAAPRRAPHLQSRNGREAPARGPHRRSRARLRDLQGILEGSRRRRRAALHAARAVPLPLRRRADSEATRSNPPRRS